MNSYERVYEMLTETRGEGREHKGHPSSTQSKMETELGTEAYRKLSSRPGDPSPVQAAKKRKKKKGKG